MDSQRYFDMRNAYMNMYLGEGKDSSYLEKDMKKRNDNNEKARKDMDKVKGQKNPHFESVDLDADELLISVCDYLIQKGFTLTAEGAEAMYNHMSDEWKSVIIEKADDNGNTACWDSHKKVGMKKKGGKMVNNCVPK